MEKKSVIKKITGSREALLAIIVVVLFAVVTVISVIPYAEVTHGDAEK